MSNKVNIVHQQDQFDSARIYKWDVNIQFGDLESDNFNIRCSSVDVPNPTHNVIDVNVRGFTKKESGAVDWNPIVLTIYEVQTWYHLRQLYDLGNRQFDYQTGYQEDKQDYSPNNAGILILLENLQDAPQENWQLYGCVLETYTPPSMTSDKTTAVEMPFTVHYDYAQLI